MGVFFRVINPWIQCCISAQKVPGMQALISYERLRCCGMKRVVFDFELTLRDNQKKKLKMCDRKIREKRARSKRLEV